MERRNRYLDENKNEFGELIQSFFSGIVPEDLTTIVTFDLRKVEKASLDCIEEMLKVIKVFRPFNNPMVVISVLAESELAKKLEQLGMNQVFEIEEVPDPDDSFHQKAA